MDRSQSEPLGAGSVSLRLYPHNELDAPAIVDELMTQAALADRHGFDGVMTSEHHGGFAGYLPNPVQAAGWALDAMAHAWAAPCPVLITLRPVALVAEEMAWLAARFPDRVGLGVAAGALADDFTIMGVGMDGLASRFADGLEELARLLHGDVGAPLSGDRALARCREHPVPLVSAAMGVTAARRAARCGAGLLLDSLSTVERCRLLTDAYRDAGGGGACVLIRRVWVGAPPVERFDRQVGIYRGYASGPAQSHWGVDEMIDGAPGEVLERLAEAMRGAGADALNLRVHAPGIPHEVVREQIVAIGSEVLRPLRG